MHRLLTRVQIAYMALFVVICAGLAAYEAYYVWPVQRCDDHGGWWSTKYHMCAAPISVSQFTGRPTPGAHAGLAKP